MSDTTTPVIDPKEYEDTPSGRAARWAAEFIAARANTEKWWEQAEKIVARYTDDRSQSRASGLVRLNLFPSNVQTMSALLCGKRPKAKVARKFADSQDDDARVAAEMQERMLNSEIESDRDTAADAEKQALDDWLIAGLGSARLRYETGEPQIIPAQAAVPHPSNPLLPGAPAIPEQEMRPDEYVCIDYAYWKDQLWSPCRTHGDLRWWAFKAPMSEAQFEKRFPEEGLWAQMPKAKASNISDAGASEETTVNDHLQRCDVWECWSKDYQTVDWYVEGYDKVLDHKKDPLGLEGFWPFPRPLLANLTTSKLMPNPDFALAQDLYDEADDLFARTTLIEQAIRVAGLFDKNIPELARLLGASATNEMIACDAWAPFAEKGGVKGAVDWFPLEMLVAALDRLEARLDKVIALIFQVTGYSDIMRGQATDAGATATEQSIKARFSSVRVQVKQDEFARFCGDIQRLKAEIISKHFQPQTIIQRSNILRTPDAQRAQAAVQLIQSRFADYRISVDPDSVSLTDFAALKAERFEYGTMLPQYFQGMMPFIQAMASIPGAAPIAIEFTLKMAQQLGAGLKGSSQMEAIFDQFVAQLEGLQQKLAAQPPPQQQPDPKVQAAQVKAQAEMGKAKADMQGTAMDLQVAQTKHVMDMQKLQAEHAVSLQSQEAQQRTEALKAVNAVASDGGGQP